MIEFRTSALVTADRLVVIQLPPETPLGEAEVVVMIGQHPELQESRGSVRRSFGSVRSGDSKSADNDRIDVDLAHAYGDTHR